MGYGSPPLRDAITDQAEHQNNWLINLEDRVFGGTDGKPGAAGCSVLDNDCSPMNNIECTEQYEKYGTDDSLSKTSYWIFQTAKGMHSKFKALKTKITETIISGLRIGQMVTDFSGNEDDTGDMVKWLASASTMGAALSGLSTNVHNPSPLQLHVANLSRLGSLSALTSLAESSPALETSNKRRSTEVPSQLAWPICSRQLLTDSTRPCASSWAVVLRTSTMHSRRPTRILTRSPSQTSSTAVSSFSMTTSKLCRWRSILSTATSSPRLPTTS